MTEKDRADLLAALDENIDWIALSFVRRPEDVAEVKAIAGWGLHPHPLESAASSRRTREAVIARSRQGTSQMAPVPLCLESPSLSQAQTSTRRCAEPTWRNSRPSPERAREGGLIGIAEIRRDLCDCEASFFKPFERFAAPYIGQQV